jgi:uncharacterized membrane protein YgcG
MKLKSLYILFLLISSILKAQEIPSLPEVYTPVFDTFGLLKTSEKNALNTKLLQLKDSTVKIQIVIIDSLKGYKVEDYSKKWAKEWNICQDDKSKEMLIFLAMSDKKMRIETNKAIIKLFPESAAYDIMDNVMSPYFAKKEYYKGFITAINEIKKYLNGYYAGTKYSKNYDHRLDNKWYQLRSYDMISIGIVLVFTLIFNILVYLKFRNKPNGIHLLYQSLWHLLGTLNILFFSALIVKELEPSISIYIFIVLFLVMQIVIFLRSANLHWKKRYLKAWIILILISWLIAVTVSVFFSTEKVYDLLSFLPHLYYGFFMISLLLFVGILNLSKRGTKSKDSEDSNSESDSSNDISS